MGLLDDIKDEVDEILSWNFKVKEYKDSVPSKSDLTLGETAGVLETAALYVDVRDSSELTEQHQQRTVAKMFNAYLNAMVRTARANCGRVRSFNGDSILVFFDPDLNNVALNAVKTAFQMKYVKDSVLVPAFRERGYEEQFEIGIGVALGRIFVTKAGIRGDDANSDLVWPSTAVNLSTALGDSASDPYNTVISQAVYDKLPEEYRTVDSNGSRVNVWELTCVEFAGKLVVAYKSRFRIEVK